jgi:hypothetical protein
MMGMGNFQNQNNNFMSLPMMNNMMLPPLPMPLNLRKKSL